MKKDKIIRIGDRVRIINPEIFIRSGYGLTVEDMIRNKMTKEDSNKIDQFLHTVGVKASLVSLGKRSEYDNAFDSVVKAIARYKLWENSWGGNERKIYTKNVPELLNIEYVVVNKKTIQTGIRIPGWYSAYDNYGERTSFKSNGSHVILEIVRQRSSNDPPSYFDEENYDRIKIQREFVEKL
jgi:hypothetical protein